MNKNTRKNLDELEKIDDPYKLCHEVNKLWGQHCQRLNKIWAMAAIGLMLFAFACGLLTGISI